MSRKKGATLLGVWWKKQMALVRRCSACGGPLVRRYVREESHWRRVCCRCGCICYTNPKVVAGLIPVMPDGRVVLLKRNAEPARGRWSYPAGYQELGETVAQAAARETWEEVHIRVHVDDLIGIYSYPDAGVVTVVYAGRVKPGHRPRAGAEAMEVALVHPRDINWRQLAFRSTRESLRDWMKRRKNKP